MQVQINITGGKQPHILKEERQGFIENKKKEIEKQKEKSTDKEQ